MLKTLPQDSEVIMSKDGEGNGFSPFSCYDLGKIPQEEVGAYVIDTFYGDGYSDQECDLEPGERDTMCPVVVLWPYG